MNKKLPVHPMWLVVGAVGCVGIGMYFVVVDPYLHPDKWARIQNDSIARLDQKRLHPYDEIMNRWTSPWESDEKKGSK